MVHPPKTRQTTTPWDGMVIRGYLNEANEMPRGGSYRSPDIFCSGQAPLQDPLEYTTPEKYGSNTPNEVYPGVVNYFYVRAKNYKPGPNSGRFELYAMPGNLMEYPSNWIRLPTSIGVDADYSVEGEHDVAINEDAFTWNFPGGKYCFFAVAVDEDHPSPVLPSMDGFVDLTLMKMVNGNVSQRNVQIVHTDIPEYHDSVPHSQGSDPARVYFALSYKNVPRGSTIIMTSGDSLPEIGPINTRVTTQVVNGTMGPQGSSPLPAWFETVISWSIHLGDDWDGIPPGAAPIVSIEPFVILERDSRLYKYGTVPGAELKNIQVREGQKVISIGGFEWDLYGTEGRTARESLLGVPSVPSMQRASWVDRCLPSAVELLGMKHKSQGPAFIGNGAFGPGMSRCTATEFQLGEQNDSVMKYPVLKVSSELTGGSAPSYVALMSYKQRRHLPSTQNIYVTISWSGAEPGTSVALKSTEYPEFDIPRFSLGSPESFFSVASQNLQRLQTEIEFQVWFGDKSIVPPKDCEFVVSFSKQARSTPGQGSGANSSQESDVTQIKVIGKAVIKF